jgi:hypothetical protein
MAESPAHIVRTIRPSRSARGPARRRTPGRESVWQLNPRRLEDARGCLDAISRQWDDALLRLGSFVEEGKAER